MGAALLAIDVVMAMAGACDPNQFATGGAGGEAALEPSSQPPPATQHIQSALIMAVKVQDQH
jgi:hypothetical protein